MLCNAYDDMIRFFVTVTSGMLQQLMAGVCHQIDLGAVFHQEGKEIYRMLIWEHDTEM